MRICMHDDRHPPHTVERWYCDGLTTEYIEEVADDARLILDKFEADHFTDGLDPAWQAYVFKTLDGLYDIVNNRALR